MLVSINWLKEYVDIEGISTGELAEAITKTGVEVDGIHGPILNDEKIVVGYVEACEQHPNADKLNLCQVNVGEEELAQIVCGAPNVAQGQYVVVARPGARLPGGLKIKKAKLRGEASEGMICSLQELGVDEKDEKFVPDHQKDGIFVFDEEVQIGEPACPLLNLDDQVLELDLTPNRADCLNMIGMAYEVAAIYNKELQLPSPTVTKADESSNDYIAVRIENKEMNPYYGAWIIKDLEVKPSPLWLRNRLISAGIRPINNLVDITNYVLLEYGQPLHAFDYDRFGSKEVVTRPAHEGETMTTLDGKERTLQPEHLLITNGEKPHALAGVMGGQDSEVQDDTTTILLEAAYFDPKTVRKASSQHNLRSEASARFEKGVDLARVKEAAIRAAELYEELAGGTILGEMVEAGSTEREPVQITFERHEINERIGTELSIDQMNDILERLRLPYEQQGEQYTVTPPSRRNDLRILEDMVEEFARLYGYDHIPYTLPTGQSNKGGLTKRQRLTREVHAYLQKTGLNEALTYSLTTEEKSKHFVSPEIQTDQEAVKLLMPMTDLHSHFRLSAIPELLSSLQYNVARNQYNLGFYELGPVYLPNEGEDVLPKEELRVAAAITGIWENHPWQGEKKPVDFFVLKGILEGLFENFLKDDVVFEKASLDGLHPGRTAILKLNGETIGYIGQLHPSIQKDHDLDETYIFDLNLEMVFAHVDETPDYEPITKYPAVSQDLAFVVDSDVQAKELEQTIYQSGQPYLKTIRVFDVYQGEHMEEGKKSIAFNLTFQNNERTLKDDEVEELRERIIQEVKATYKAELRG